MTNNRPPEPVSDDQEQQFAAFVASQLGRHDLSVAGTDDFLDEPAERVPATDWSQGQGSGAPNSDPVSAFAQFLTASLR
jgi:hypothetical protein